MKVRRQPTGTFDHRALKRALMNFDNGSSMVHQWFINGGESWIRTSVGIANGFTVRPF